MISKGEIRFAVLKSKPDKSSAYHPESGKSSTKFYLTKTHSKEILTGFALATNQD
jgi:hypothetical protein